MSKHLLLLLILLFYQFSYPRSNALDDYWKEQDKVALSTHNDSDGLTIVLSKKEPLAKSPKKNINKLAGGSKNKKTQVVIRSDRQKKTKHVSFFVDQKLVKKQIVKPKQITTMSPTKVKKQFFVVEKKQITTKKTLVRKGLTNEPKLPSVSAVKLANKSQKLGKSDPARKPTEVDWLIEQEINEAQNEFNESAVICEKDGNCDHLLACESQKLKSKKQFLSLTKYFDEIRMRPLNDQWLETNTGLRVEKKCLEDYGQEFPQLLTNSITEGLSCLDRLQGDGSDFNQIMVVSLLQNSQSPLKLSCENGDPKNKFSAEATLFPSEEKYPQITLKKGQGQVSQQKIKEVIFHELMHTNGYAHQADIEYMYACQDCCRDENQKKASCQICKKNYITTTDVDYQEDVIKWMHEVKGSGASLMAFISTMSNHSPKLKDEIEKLINAMKLNPSFDRLTTQFNSQLPLMGQNKKGQDAADEEFVRALVHLKQGQLGQARQKLATIQALITSRGTKSRSDLFSNEQISMLYEQLNSQLNQKEIRNR